jgi:ribonuclease HI
MPIETRKRWGGKDYRQEHLVEDVITGEKITAVYDPTQRITQVDPDVEAEVIAAGREVPGDKFKRTVTWVWPNGSTIILKKLIVPVKATPQDLLFRVTRALKAPELYHGFTKITPEDWRFAPDIRVEFAYERPVLSTSREVTEKQFRDEFQDSLPVFIETDGACAGNEGKISPGGWGAAIVQGNRILRRWGARPDTSNNEMEYMAMLESLNITTKGAYVIIESDSHGCIDGITKYQLRWEKHGWRKEDGKPVENAELIQMVCREVDRRHVGFRKVKWHNDDPWNDLEDALAVKGRNQQATEVTIALIFRPVIEKKEGFVAFPRFSVSSHANI